MKTTVLKQAWTGAAAASGVVDHRDHDRHQLVVSGSVADDFSARTITVKARPLDGSGYVIVGEKTGVTAGVAFDLVGRYDRFIVESDASFGGPTPDIVVTSTRQTDPGKTTSLFTGWAGTGTKGAVATGHDVFDTHHVSLVPVAITGTGVYDVFGKLIDRDTYVYLGELDVTEGGDQLRVHGRYTAFTFKTVSAVGATTLSAQVVSMSQGDSRLYVERAGDEMTGTLLFPAEISAKFGDWELYEDGSGYLVLTDDAGSNIAVTIKDSTWTPGTNQIFIGAAPAGGAKVAIRDDQDTSQALLRLENANTGTSAAATFTVATNGGGAGSINAFGASNTGTNLGIANANAVRLLSSNGALFVMSSGTTYFGTAGTLAGTINTSQEWGIGGSPVSGYALAVGGQVKVASGLVVMEDTATANGSVRYRAINDAQSWSFGVFGGDADRWVLRDETNAKLPIRVDPNSATSSLRINSNGVGILGEPVSGYALAVAGKQKWDVATEDVTIEDAGSTGATEQDWIEVTVGGNTGYIRVYATK